MALVVKSDAGSFTSLTPPKEVPVERVTSPEPYIPPPPSLWIEVPVKALDSMEVGSEFSAKVKCRLRSKEARENKGGKKRLNYSVEVLAMKVGK